METAEQPNAHQPACDHLTQTFTHQGQGQGIGNSGSGKGTGNKEKGKWNLEKGELEFGTGCRDTG